MSRPFRSPPFAGIGLAVAAVGGCAHAGVAPEAPAPVPSPAIQGRSHLSPVAGRRLRSAGTVTSVARGVATVQDPRGDGDPGSSDALFLELGRSPEPRVGDRVVFAGTVVERVPGGEKTANLSLTTVVADSVRVEGRGALPAAVRLTGERLVPAGAVIGAAELPVNLRDPAQARANRFNPGEDAIDFLESLEGMRVTIAAPVAVSAIQVFNAGAAEVVVLPDGGRHVPAARRTEAGGILLQSGPENLGNQNPERIQVQLDSALVPGPWPMLSVGDRLDDATGIMRYDFGNFEIAVTAPLRVGPAGRAPAATSLTRADGRLTFASYNVLNLGAGEEDSVQRGMLGRQIAGPLGAPAVVALQEIQDDSGERDDGMTSAERTLGSLAAAILAAGGPAYAWIDVPPTDGRQGGAPGGNIRNAFLYDTTRIRLARHGSVTPAVLAAAGVADPEIFRDSRDPLLAEFRAGDRSITFINNHLTSRYGSTPTYGSVQPFVQAGERERAAQALALHRVVTGLLASAPDAAIVVLGDMNTFEFTDDLADLLPGTPPVLFPLSSLVPAGRRYSYNFEGNSQVLDHVFVTRALLAGAELEYVHLNTDFPALPGATASDHDPVVARVRW